MVDLIIRSAPWIITMDAERRVITGGAIVIDNKNIVEVDKTSKVIQKYPSAQKTIDASDKIVLLGLIYCHLRTTQQLARGLADNLFLPSYIHGRIFPYEAALTEDDVYYSALCACLEAINTGSTCIVDPGGYHMEKVVDAIQQTGLRTILQRSMVDIHGHDSPAPGKLSESTKSALKAGEDFVSNFNGFAGGRIKAWFFEDRTYDVQPSHERGKTVG